MSSQGSSLFLRKWSLVVSKNGTTEDLSQLHFTASGTQSDVETPNSAIIRCYNLAASTAKTLLAGEFKYLTLSAGYQNGPYGVAFDGTIKQVRQGKESQTDTYVDFLVADSDEAYNFSVINQTLAENTTTGDQIAALAAAMGVPVGYVSASLEVGNPENSIRGKVLYGMSKNILRQLALANGARWSLQNGKLVFISNSDYIPAAPIVLSPATGLIGIPEQTQSGISCQALYNPKLIIGYPVQIASTLINTAQFNIAYGDLAQNPENIFPPIAGAGLYRIAVSEFSLDNRGQDWYSNLTCFAINPDQAAAQSVNPWPGAQAP